ncbi:MAG TPA: bifunctional rhamnulose-1-phosphate aldolase/short-chain dehydrogenase [Planctomycetota bacterium]|nr:bifunctional rhamnulose-1-phosphate aldolase/short-chain dehydrogenase [Planctomycetota bacterium]
MLENLWKDEDAKKYEGYAELVYRANILGQDPSVTNWKGGNISGKYTENNYQNMPIHVLRVKGSGSDLKTALKDDFVGVAHDPVLRLYDRKEMSDEDMVAYLAHCLTDIPSKRPSIETLMHSFLPYKHVDHTHADYALWFAALDGGRKLAEDLFQEELVWIDYHRPGFHLAKTVSEAVKKNAKAKCVILAKHGLLTWGETSKESYHSTLSVLQKFEAAVHKKMTTTKVFGGARSDTLPADQRRELLAQVMPAVRGAVSALRTTVLHYDDSAPVLEFVNGSTSKDLSAVGAACPDHLVSTKVVPYFAKWDPKSGTADDLKKELLPAIGTYRSDYEAYFKKYNRNDKMKMDDPYPRIILVPGVGMLTTGKSKEVAVAASWLYHRAITVMKGASSQGKFLSLNEEESFNIEYWPLERYKLTTLPPDKEMTGKVVLITGAASGIGKACAMRFASEGAHVVVADINAEGAVAVAKEIGKGAIAAPMNVTDENQVAEGFRKAVLEFGGIDTVVVNAGMARAFPVEDHPLDQWNMLQSILTTGYFLTSRESFRIFKRQARGGTIVFIVSKNGLVAGKNNLAYSAAKAAELHMARCLAEEGGAHGIRVNTVNPDAVLDTGIWNKEWRAERARDYGIKPDELEAFYKNRTTMKVGVVSADIAEAVYFFASSRSAKSTGNILNVDGGVLAAYPR